MRAELVLFVAAAAALSFARNGDNLTIAALSHSQPPVVNVHEAEQWISHFVAELRKFVHGLEFDHIRFVDKSAVLGDQLLEQSGNISRAAYIERSLSGKLRYAKHLYKRMVQAVEDLRFYGTTTDQLLVRCMTQFNVALLALPVPHKGDSEVERYASTLASFTTSLNFWHSTFGNLTDVPASVRLRFVDEERSARYTLRVLRGHTP